MNHITSKDLHELKYSIYTGTMLHHDRNIWYMSVIRQLVKRGHVSTMYLWNCPKCG